MPAGVSWSRYISFSVAAMLSMLAGSQIVHQRYSPLQNMNEYINKELQNFPDDIQAKIKQELQEEGVLKKEM